MADFIYLMQNRLTPAQWRALQAVREAARTHSMPLFLVGGAVRDLSSGSPVRDLDFAVQGDVDTLLADLQAGGATVTGRHPIFGSAYLSFRGGARAEIAPSLSISYPKPGQAEAQPAPILDDLRRRDFTVNAMAVSLNEGSYGLLLDPLNGTADLENRELRLVSNYGFIEQPALLLRSARLGERLGFTLEERTAGRYQTAKDEDYIKALPALDRGYELEEIFHEEDPLTILEHMAAEGWQQVLFPALRAADADRNAIESVRELIGQLEGQGIHPDPSTNYFPLLTAKLSEKDRATLKQSFPRQGFVAQVESLESRAKELGTQLTSKTAALPSDSWRLLTEAEPDAVLWLAVHSRTGAVQAKIKAFLKEWPQMRQKIPYAMMQEMRITPDLPVYDQLLNDLFFALMDGKLDTPEATRAFLEPFSPPAPPQVTVRRRPAKATRSRAKRAAAVEASEDAEDNTQDSAEETSTSTDDLELDEDNKEAATESADDQEAADTPDLKDDTQEEGEVDTNAEEPKERKKSSSKPATKAAARPPANAAKTSPAKTKESTPPVKAAPAKSAPPAKAVTSKPGKSAAVQPKVAAGSAKVPTKTPAAKMPAKAVSKTLPAKTSAKNSAASPKSGAKSAGKPAPAKKAAAPVAKKAVSAKAAPAKKTAKATPVKPQAKNVSGKPKAAVPSKATKKSPTKGSGKR